MVLGDRRRHRRLLATVHGRRGRLRQRADRVGLAGDAGERFLDAFETTDRQAELLADARIGAGDDRAHLGTAAGGGGQGDRAADRQALAEHAPAFADALLLADDLRQRQEHFMAAHRAVLERRVQREVAAADFHARGFARHQRQGDAQIALVAQQAVRVVHAEGQADDAGDRRQGDVALVESQLDADHLGAVPVALADDAVVRNGGRVGTGERTGQAKARHLAAVGQARQVVVLLLLGAVMHQQFARAQRVGHADGGADHAGNRSQLLDHLVVGQRREAQAAVGLGNDHAEELVLLDELPHFRRQIGVDVGDFPVVGHPAKIFHRTVQEGLLLGRQFGLRLGQELIPVRIAGEQFTLEADRAGFQRDALGLRQRRQDLAVEGQQRCGDQRLADGRNQQRDGDEGHDDGGDDRGGRIGAEQPAGYQQGRGDRRPIGQPQAVIGRERARQQEGEEGG